ncbi:SIMPL domain-containing protein [Methylobacterium persicinum]|uniref:Uncharacterized protein YggE n=1 Tax=Methylobacterium persicinum TaxID=374426 RepID=A0ABU0HFM5_9HYPH|nr:SIMPL domain-containing protein [Methylobacterium persicinum]MDQ0441128.1 uncharacterized protein YggE [Methylobacterium persicinum]GJE40625.1 26 kDa periplasmic immunogenic protein [Methylobacterium persicinum]
MRAAPFVLVLVSLAGAAAADEAPCERHISVTGHATSTRAPDFAEVVVGVETKGANAAAALDATSKAVAGVSALARDLGIPPADIVTAAVTLRPATRTVVRPGGGYSEEPDGYAAGNVVRVRLSDMGRLGDLLRRAVEGGANRIDSLTFGLRDPDGAMASLQAAAAKDARARAAALAEAVGATLGPLCTLNTLGASPQPYAMRTMAMASPKAMPVPVESGTVDTEASVNAVFALAP